MQCHDSDHEVRAPVMQGPEQPAQRLLIVQKYETGPSVMRRWRIDERQTDPGHNLDEKTEQGATAKHIEPTMRTGRHGVPSRGREQLREGQTLVEPEGDSAQ